MQLVLSKSEIEPSGATTQGQSGPGSNGNEVCAPHSPKPQHHWNLTIRLFSVVSRTLIGGVLPLGRDAVSVFYSPSWLGNLARTNKKMYIYTYICINIKVNNGKKSKVVSSINQVLDDGLLNPKRYNIDFLSQ